MTRQNASSRQAMGSVNWRYYIMHQDLHRLNALSSVVYGALIETHSGEPLRK